MIDNSNKPNLGTIVNTVSADDKKNSMGFL